MRSVFFFIWSALIIGLSACSSDPCDDVDCMNGGTCNDGTCECGTFYEGPSCETEVRSKYLGSYDGTLNFVEVDLSTSVSRAFSAVAGDPSRMINIEDGYEIVLTSATDFTIPLQEVDRLVLVNRYEGQGSFAADGSTVELSYTLTVIPIIGEEGQPTPFEFSGTRQ